MKFVHSSWSGISLRTMGRELPNSYGFSASYAVQFIFLGNSFVCDIMMAKLNGCKLLQMRFHFDRGTRG